MGKTTMMSWGLIVAGLLFYAGAVAGLWTARPTPPADIGAITTTAMMILFGVGGLMVARTSVA